MSEFDQRSRLGNWSGTVRTNISGFTPREKTTSTHVDPVSGPPINFMPVPALPGAAGPAGRLGPAGPACCPAKTGGKVCTSRYSAANFVDNLILFLPVSNATLHDKRYD